jgi:hypothetical protein
LRFRLQVISILVCCGGLHTQQELPRAGNSSTRYQNSEDYSKRRDALIDDLILAGLFLFVVAASMQIPVV